MAAHPNPKGAHYTSQLYSSLCAGQWSSPAPAKAHQGLALPWLELFRKYRKHAEPSKDNEDFATVAELNKALGSALDQLTDWPGHGLELGEECILDETQREAGGRGYEIASNLEDLTRREFITSYFAYTLGRPSDCLTRVARISSQVSEHLSEKVSSPATGASSTAHTGESESSNEKSWARIEAIRSLCLSGMSHEKLVDPTSALRTYLSALPLIASFCSMVPTTSSVHKQHTPHDEFWNWTERLLRRAIIVSASLETESLDKTIFLLDRYKTCSSYWTRKFRPAPRSTIASMHLRALIIRASIHSTSSGKITWLHTAASIIKETRELLDICPKAAFPKAGARNVIVEDFVDLVVAVWEAGGSKSEETGWVIDVLWFATRLTFNSLRVFRHMTRVFETAGDITLARRTLRLYRQIEGKARILGSETAEPLNIAVPTLIHGARMLCRYAGPGHAGEDEVIEAGGIIADAKKHLEKLQPPVSAGVYLASAIQTSLLAHYPGTPAHTRGPLLAETVTALKKSIEIYPTASAQYHLAITLSRPGSSQDLTAAIDAAQAAVEGFSLDPRAWHLLGLILTAQGHLEKASGVLAFGAELGDGSEEDDEEDDEESYEQVSSSGDQEIKSLLANGSTTLPPSTKLLSEIVCADAPPLSRTDRFAHALQLRMSQLVITEALQGPEGSATHYKEVFEWVAERRSHAVADFARRASGSSDLPHNDSTKNNGYTPARPLSILNEKEQASATPPITVTSPSSTRIDQNEADEQDTNRVRRRVSQRVKERVNNRMGSISRRVTMRRTSSFPDFQTDTSYDPSRYAQSKRPSARGNDSPRLGDLSMPSTRPTSPVSCEIGSQKVIGARLLSDLWLMSAATFRRLGKLDEAKGAIQDAEERDYENPNVWVQLGLYDLAHDDRAGALAAFQKALFLAPDDIAANVHICRLHLSSIAPAETPDAEKVDLAVGLLAHLTRNAGADSPEPWYYLSKAYGLQGRPRRQKEALETALRLSESRMVRGIGEAIGWVL